MHDVLKNLATERAEVLGQARDLLDRAESEGRSLSGEAESTWQKHMDRITEIDVRSQQIEKTLRAEAAGDERRESVAGVVRNEGRGYSAEGRALRDFIAGRTDSFSADFTAVARHVDNRGRVTVGESRDLFAGGAATGGAATVPTTFSKTLVEHLVESSAIRRTSATILTTDSGERLLIPNTTKYGKAVKTAEGALIGQDDPEFGQAVLEAFKYPILIRVSNELLADSGVDIEGFLARQAAEAIADPTDFDYIVGTGAAGQPQGIVGASSLGITAGSATALTTDELLDLYFSVKGPYRQKAFWLMNESTLLLARKLKDADGRYLYEPNITGNAADTLFGRPVVTSPHMPAMAANAKPIVFGDTSKFYVRDVQGLRFERSEHAEFDRDVTVFRAILRTDSELVDRTGAVKHWLCPAA